MKYALPSRLNFSDFPSGPKDSDKFRARKYSLKSIGNHFGGRDHSTVIHAVQSVNDMIDTDNIFRNSIQDLKKKFQIKSL